MRGSGDLGLEPVHCTMPEALADAWAWVEVGAFGLKHRDFRSHWSTFVPFGKQIITLSGPNW